MKVDSDINLFQANGVMQWIWAIGNASTYQDFSVKPAEANCDHCRVTDITYSKSNRPFDPVIVFITVDLQYSAPSIGGLLNFFAISAP